MVAAALRFFLAHKRLTFFFFFFTIDISFMIQFMNQWYHLQQKYMHTQLISEFDIETTADIVRVQSTTSNNMSSNSMTMAEGCLQI